MTRFANLRNGGNLPRSPRRALWPALVVALVALIVAVSITKAIPQAAHDAAHHGGCVVEGC